MSSFAPVLSEVQTALLAKEGCREAAGGSSIKFNGFTYLFDEETGGTLKSDESSNSNPKSENSNWTSESNLRSRISDLSCRIRPYSKFPFSLVRVRVSL